MKIFSKASLTILFCIIIVQIGYILGYEQRIIVHKAIFLQDSHFTLAIFKEKGYNDNDKYYIAKENRQNDLTRILPPSA